MSTSRRRPGRPSNPVSRDQLIRLARQIFAQHGYAGASMSRIAEGAGIRKSSLFHHFATKEALYDAVLGSLLTELASMLPQFEPGTDWLEQLDLLGHTVVRYLGEHPDAARLLVREVVGGPALERGAPTIKAILGTLDGFLEAGVAVGAIPAQDTRQLTMSLIGLHLLYFAAGDVSALIVEKPPFTEEGICARQEVICRQVRGLCGVAP